MSVLERLTKIVPSLRKQAARQRSAEQNAPKAKPEATPRKEPNLNDLLVIPVCEEPREEQMRSYYFNQGRFLARQERWEDLTKLVIAEDKAHRCSDGGMPLAELLCQGARSDVVALAEHLLFDDEPDSIEPLTDAISALEAVLGEYSDNYVIAIIVAMAHLDIAWAWRGTEAPSETPARNLEAFKMHCTRARQVLDSFCGFELGSPILFSSCCALLVGMEDARDYAADHYEDLIDLAPSQQTHMRALGHHMLPQWFGSYATLELEARRTAARTQDIWGAGAYAWTFFDALLVDPSCASVLDVPFFLEGLRDILERSEDQHNANLFASYTAVSIANAAQETDDLAAAAALEQVQKAAQWIMSDYLHELHPLVWGHAMEGFNNQARIASVEALFKQGREKADQVFVRFFGEQIKKGNSLIFTPQGLYVQQA